MAQYKLGTISIANGTNVVTGVATQFLANVAVGNSFKVFGVNALYNVIAVDSDTQIRISPNYAGASVSGAQYQISKDFTPNLGLAEIETGDSEFAFHLTHEVIRKLDAAIPDYTAALASKSPLAGPGSGQSFSVGPLSVASITTVSGANAAYKLNTNADSYAQLMFYEAGNLKWNVYNDFGTSGGSKVRITQAGNLLINTTAGLGVLRTKVATDKNLAVRLNGELSISALNNADSAFVPLYFDATKHCFNGGNVLINTATDNGSGAKLQVNGGISASGSAKVLTTGASSELWLHRTDGYTAVKLIGNTLSDGQGFKINVFGTDAFAISSAGHLIAYSTPVYADNAAAATLAAGTVYRTSTGQLMIKY